MSVTQALAGIGVYCLALFTVGVVWSRRERKTALLSVPDAPYSSAQSSYPSLARPTKELAEK